MFSRNYDVGGRQMKYRKPDILLVLALSVGIGVVVTGSAQSIILGDQSAATARQQIQEKAVQLEGAVARTGTMAKQEQGY